MFGGVLDACPKLNVCLPHAGGVSPYLWARWRHGQEVRNEPHVNTDTPVATLWHRFYFDTITHNPSALRWLLSEVGVDRVMAGSDHPFDMGDINQVARVEDLGLPAADVEKLVGGTARSLLRL